MALAFDPRFGRQISEFVFGLIHRGNSRTVKTTQSKPVCLKKQAKPNQQQKTSQAVMSPRRKVRASGMAKKSLIT